MPPRVINGYQELQACVGQQVGTSDWFVIDQQLIDSFADVTRDRQWIHVDPARAQAESPYKATVAHGFLTLSLLSHLQAQAVQVQGEFTRAINYGFNKVRFPAPVRVGSRVRLHTSLQSLEQVEGGVQATWNVTVEIEGSSKPAVAAEWLSRFYR
jgi:acyl dehydratase